MDVRHLSDYTTRRIVEIAPEPNTTITVPISQSNNVGGLGSSFVYYLQTPEQ